MNFENVLHFWLDAGHKNWFNSSAAFDQEITKHFGTLRQQALKDDLVWEKTAPSALGLIILLDQFSRNIYRKQKQAFEADIKTQNITLYAIDQGFDMQTPKEERMWFYMPLMHAENEKLQRLSVSYFRKRVGNELNIKYAEDHAEIIFRFGRFPHRNAILERKNTAEEIEYLKEANSSYGQ